MELKDKVKKLFTTGFFHIFGSSVLNKIIVFFSNIIVVRIISKVDFGIYTYALNIVSFVLIFTGLGMVTGTFQLCSEFTNDEEKLNRIYQYGSSVGIKFNILLSFVIVCIAMFFDFPIKGQSEMLLLMCLNPIFLIAFEFQQIYLRAKLKNQEFSYGTTINTLAVTIGSIVGALLLNTSGLVIGRYVAYVVTIIAMFAVFKAPFHFRKVNIEPELKNSLYKISVVSMANNGISELLYLLDIFILGLVVADESMIASYKVATVIPSACIFIPMAIVTYIYPFFASHKNDYDWTIKNYKKLVKFLGLGNMAISAFLIIFAELIIKIVYGEQYLDATLCFRILSLNYFFSGTFRIISGNLLVTQRKLTFNLIVNVVSGIVNVIGNLILIPALYSTGAALTTLLVVLVSSIMSTTYYVYIIKKGKNVEKPL